jgi:hypothetical protein
MIEKCGEVEAERSLIGVRAGLRVECSVGIRKPSIPARDAGQWRFRADRDGIRRTGCCRRATTGNRHTVLFGAFTCGGYDIYRDRYSRLGIRDFFGRKIVPADRGCTSTAGNLRKVSFFFSQFEAFVYTRHDCRFFDAWCRTRTVSTAFPEGMSNTRRRSTAI